MNVDLNQKNNSESIKVNLDQFNMDEFNLDIDSFKPMTKGLGFHHQQKKQSFKVSNVEKKNIKLNSRNEIKLNTNLNQLTKKNNEQVLAQIPTGLEAFYSSEKISNEKQELKSEEIEEISYNLASSPVQFLAFIIDMFVILSFVCITGVVLGVASGFELKMLLKIISINEILLFSILIFSIYYLFYFAILEMSSTPGKTILGIKLVHQNNTSLTLKNTLTRTLITLVSGVVLFLPLLFDFQGKLSDTKVVKV